MGGAPSHEESSSAHHPLRRSVLGPRPSNPYLTNPLEAPRSEISAGRDIRPIEYRPPVEQSEIVRNVVYVTKGSLMFEPAGGVEDLYLVTFRFDAEVEGWITVYYQAKEVVTRQGEGEGAEVSTVGYVGKDVPVKTKFGKGRGQVYRQKLGKGVDIRGWSSRDMKYREGGDNIPLVVRLDASYPEGWGAEERLRVKCQVTFCEILERDGGRYGLRVVAQQVLVGGTLHRLLDLYGIGSKDVKVEKRGDGELGTDGAHECVICLTEPCNTAVLPCNHFCLCEECATILCKETDYSRKKCPVCRTQLGSLLKIIGGGGEGESDEGSRSADGGSSVGALEGGNGGVGATLRDGEGTGDGNVEESESEATVNVKPEREGRAGVGSSSEWTVGNTTGQ